MKSWLISYSEEHSIFGIADGNAQITTYFDLVSDKSSSHMGFRSQRFVMIIENNKVIKLNIEEKGNLEVSSAQKTLQYL